MDKANFLQRIIGNLKERFGPVHYTAQTPSIAPQSEAEKFKKAIAQLETNTVKGDKRLFRKPSGSKALGDDLGTYQITEGELATYGKRFLSEPLNTKQFMASTTAESSYMDNKFEYYRRLGYTPEQIADIHRKGYKRSGPPGTTKYQSPGYVKAFSEIYNK